MPLARLHSADEWVAHFGEARKPTVVSIGNFDGAHLGHQKILRALIDRARRDDMVATALTFFPHTARVLRPTEAPSLLQTIDQRLASMEEIGIDAALVLRFDAVLAQVTAQEFAERFLAETLRARAVLVGPNFRFGHRHTGDVRLLEELGSKLGFEVGIVSAVIVDGVVVSSTAIRQAIREGRVDDSQKLLGRPYSLAGEIQPATGQGRKLIVPTLNLRTEQELLPKNGVYATETVVGGRVYRSATNVGVRPTFDGHTISVESNLFDFSDNLTSGPMEVRFWKRLRDEHRFSGPDTLREQILKDFAQAQEFFRTK
jgi:riboflavin kinase/FMN adenylyltransferase